MFAHPDRKHHQQFLETLRSKAATVKSAKATSTSATLMGSTDYGPHLDRHESQDALDVITEVYKATGKVPDVESMPNIPKSGKAKFILGELKTDPALDLLGKYQWREFFEQLQGIEGTDQSSNRRASSRPNSATRSRPRSRPSSASSVQGRRLKTNPNPITASSMQSFLSQQKLFVSELQSKYTNMRRRVNLLWSELKFSEEDKKFYRDTLLQGPPDSAKQLIELAKYIKCLQQLRFTTVEVLKSIEAREACVVNCYDVIAAMNRKTLKNARNSSDVWKSEIISSIEDVAVASVAVVKCIQEWRSILWRPQPFVWNGVNYLIKMGSDMKILEQESLGGFLSSLPISPLGMLCVTFDKRQVENLTSTVDDTDQEAFRLKVTVLTVIREPEVQKALSFEKKTLKESGVFIPKVRLIPLTSITTALEGVNSQLPSAKTFSYLETMKVNDPEGPSFEELTAIFSTNVNDSLEAAGSKRNRDVDSSNKAFDELLTILGQDKQDTPEDMITGNMRSPATKNGTPDVYGADFDEYGSP